MAQSTEQTAALAAALYRFGNAVAGVCSATVMQQGLLLARGAQGAQGRAAATQEQARAQVELQESAALLARLLVGDAA